MAPTEILAQQHYAALEQVSGYDIISQLTGELQAQSDG